MGLWGADTNDESKPKNLTTEQKKEVFANNMGWVQQAGTAASGNDNANATPEVLVAIGDLATSLGQATIDAVNFGVGQTISGAGGSTITVEVHYNEEVTIAGGSPLMYVSNNQAGSGGASSITLTMDGGAGTRDTLSFSGTATNANVNANDVISIAAQTINLNGATIVDAIGGGNAVRTISANVGSAAGTITVGS
tara:strand:+ start:117 stop:701 length:585 start_codon:yes stop_codon:yes gene_type:complete